MSEIRHKVSENIEFPTIIWFQISDLRKKPAGITADVFNAREKQFILQNNSTSHVRWKAKGKPVLRCYSCVRIFVLTVIKNVKYAEFKTDTKQILQYTNV